MALKSLSKGGGKTLPSTILGASRGPSTAASPQKVAAKEPGQTSRAGLLKSILPGGGGSSKNNGSTASAPLSIHSAVADSDENPGVQSEIPGKFSRKSTSKKDVAQSAIRSFLQKDTEGETRAVVPVLGLQEGSARPLASSPKAAASPQNSRQAFSQSEKAAGSLPEAALDVPSPGAQTVEVRGSLGKQTETRLPNGPEDQKGSDGVSCAVPEWNEAVASVPPMPAGEQVVTAPPPSPTATAEKPNPRLSVLGSLRRSLLGGAPPTDLATGTGSSSKGAKRGSLVTAKDSMLLSAKRLSSAVTAMSLPTVAAVAHRITGMKSLKRRMKSEIKARERREELQKSFDQLHRRERQAMSMVFTHFDLDESGSLFVSDLRCCLAELGLRGTTAQEKQEITKLCDEVGRTKGHKEACSKADEERMTMKKTRISVPTDPPPQTEVCLKLHFLEFFMELVPHVRNRLQELRGNELLRTFIKFDTNQSGELSAGECKGIARSLGIDPKVVADVLDDHPGQDLDFEGFQQVIMRGKELAQRMCRQKERVIQSLMNMDDDTFNHFRGDLVTLYESFLRHDGDKNLHLDSDEIMGVIREFGLLPKTMEAREEVRKILEDSCSGELNFIDFLNFLDAIRGLQLAKTERELRKKYNKLDGHRTGRLGFAECSQLLGDVNLAPKTHEEQQEIRVLFEEFDEYGEGSLPFPEFHVLTQRVNERLNMMEFEVEIEHGLRLGFKEVEVCHFRRFFDELDADGSDSLDIDEVRTLLTKLRRNVSNKELKDLFEKIDEDRDEYLCFKEFIQLIHMMNHGTGMDSVLLPRSVSDLDIRVLRRILEIFKLSKDFVRSLPAEDLVSFVCEYFGVSRTAPITQALGAKTMDDLYLVAEKRAQEV